MTKEEVYQTAASEFGLSEDIVKAIERRLGQLHDQRRTAINPNFDGEVVSPRLRHVIENKGFKTWKEIEQADLDYWQWWREPNVGHKTCKELFAVLERRKANER